MSAAAAASRGSATVHAFDAFSPKKLVTVYHLELNDDGAPPKRKTYNRLPPPNEPYILRISINAGSAASRAGILFTNFPLDGTDFDRSRYHQVVLPQDFSKPFEINLSITKAGAFEYFIEYDRSSSSGATNRIRSPKGYFAVDPILSVPARTSILSEDYSILPVGSGATITDKLVPLPLDGLVIQTVIAKWMGTLDEWTPNLDLMRDRGYNMIHFTPLQQRGESNSPYSILDQLQFSDDLYAPNTSKKEKVSKMKDTLANIKKKWGILSMMDIVLNHTANNSPWLQEHPEAGYNAQNSPHLQGALELDTALLEFSASLESHGLPIDPKTPADLAQIMEAISEKVIKPLKLYEFYTISVEKAKKAFEAQWTTTETPAPLRADDLHLAAKSDKELAEAFASACLPKTWTDLGARSGPAVNQEAAVSFVSVYLGTSPKASVDAASAAFTKILDIVNVPRYELYDADLAVIISNTRNRIRYTRLDEDGPKMGPVSIKKPLVEPLFTRLPSNATTKSHDPLALALANNGWIWDADPLQDFASAASRTYIRRDLIVWGDCVKLRYGKGPEDSPWLWTHMTQYVTLLAGIFDGFRLDNSHSTPIHVGEILLDAARRVNPNLYVCAELFTGNQELDLHFVCRLGLNSLIREAMNAPNAKEQSSLLYSYGLGKPIGSMDIDCLTETATIAIKGREMPCKIVQLPGSVPHAFLMDCTHDNESPASKRTAEDALPTGSLVTFARSAIGSNRGFDDLYPRLLDVVSETRKYELYPDSTTNGIGSIKRLLNHLHTEMVLAEAIEGHFSQEGEYVTAHRVNPVTHKGFLLVARTAISSGASKERGSVAPMRLDGTQVQFVAGASLDIASGSVRDTEDTLRGLEAKLESITVPSPAYHSGTSGSYSEIVIPEKFPPGSILIFATWMDELPSDLDETCVKGADAAFAELDMVDLNSVLFRADGEERDAVGGDGAYTIPGVPTLVYCGLQGWMAHIKSIMASNDLGHPLCSHLRSGVWPMDYVVSRLEKQLEQLPRLKAPAAWLKERFEVVKKSVPPFLRPKYFAMIINVAYKAGRDRALSQCSPLIQRGTPFVGALALTSVQMYGQVKSASLDPSKTTPSLAAGLPHFTAGWARTWGRDVFISLRGLFLVTGQFAAARDHILAFCSVLKHGLIPNLLDSGRTPRYNSRDSPWFMLQNIQDYVVMAPNGLALLDDTVKRRFPLSDEWVPFDDPKAYSVTSTVADVIQEILQRHASGIHFREYNAGPNLDMQMSDRGFNIDVEVDWETGIIHGGNEWNCGTWMDKMGESEKAGNKGCPGTPRDGAPIEITGLLKSCLRWLAELSKSGHFPHKGVEATVAGQKKLVTYAEWDDLLQKSFERCYFVPADAAEDSKYLIDTQYVQRRGIYKDVLGTGKGRERADYQLRANSAVAMSVAPELFDPAHARGALDLYLKYLVGPLGVKTLDPADPDYRGSYDNSNDSHDRHVAKGWNYHQGPEWVWPIGYYLRAYLIFDGLAGAGKDNIQNTFHEIFEILARHRAHMESDPWAGLPELTNENGWECYDSCRTQAWSSSTVLDVLDDIANYKKTGGV